MTHDELMAEQNVIGSILIDPRCLRRAAELLTPQDFLVAADEAIFRAALELDRQERPIDPVLILEQARGQCEQVSVQYMMQLMAVTGTAANLEEYARVTRERAQEHAILAMTEQAGRQIRDHEPPAEVLGALIQQAEQLQAGGAAELIEPIQAASLFMDHRDRVEAGQARTFVPTGYRDLDDLLGGGMLATGVYILAARPGMGKTTLAINIADRVAKQTGPVLFVSLEMDTEQLMAKRAAKLCGISGSRLLMGKLQDWETARLADALEELAKLPVLLNRQASADVDQIESMARKVKGLRLLVIDYFGIIDPGKARKKNSRVEYTTEISGAVKLLARRLKIPVLLLAQLNRELEKRADRRPQLSDLRDTGAVEQDADGVIFLNRPEYYQSPDRRGESGPEQVEVILAKHRHGATGSCELAFALSTSKVLATSNDPRRAYRNSEAFRRAVADDQNTGEEGQK